MENQYLTEGIPTETSPSSPTIEAAARWLSDHRDECFGKIIPTLKERFGLRNIQAIEAAKLAHALQYAGVQ